MCHYTLPATFKITGSHAFWSDFRLPTSSPDSPEHPLHTAVDNKASQHFGYAGSEKTGHGTVRFTIYRRVYGPLLKPHVHMAVSVHTPLGEAVDMVVTCPREPHLPGVSPFVSEDSAIVECMADDIMEELHSRAHRPVKVFAALVTRLACIAKKGRLADRLYESVCHEFGALSYDWAAGKLGVLVELRESGPRGPCVCTWGHGADKAGTCKYHPEEDSVGVCGKAQ